VRYQDIADGFGIRTSLTVIQGDALAGATNDEPEDGIREEGDEATCSDELAVP
jgi:hypothetical protein